MFPLLFHYYDVSRQDPLLKPNNNNVMEVPGSSSIRVVPREDGMFHVNLAMEIPRELKERRHSVSGSTGSSIRGQKVVSIHFKKEVKDGYVSHLARQSTLRGHGMYNFSVRISTVMSLLEDPEIREHSILFYWETEFEFCPELEEHFEIFEQGLFHVTLVTSANTKDETLPPWSGFVQKEA